MFNSDFMRGFYTCAFRVYDVMAYRMHASSMFISIMMTIITMRRWRRMWDEMMSIPIICKFLCLHHFSFGMDLSSLHPFQTVSLFYIVAHFIWREFRNGNVFTSGKCPDLKINLYFSLESHTNRTAVNSPKSLHWVQRWSKTCTADTRHRTNQRIHSLRNAYEQFADCTENGAQPFYDARKIDI